MQKEVFVITFVILLSSTVESHAKKPIRKVLSIVKEIKDQMVTVDDMTEIKNQIVDEVVDAINPTIAASCSCCNKPQHCDGGQGIFLAGGIVNDWGAAFPGFYNPLTNEYCNITTHMNHPRHSSTTTGFIACGGSDLIDYYYDYGDYYGGYTPSPTSAAYNCEMFDPSSGTWSNYATWYPSFPGRRRHVAWMSSIGLFLIGGLDSMNTSMLISNDGSITAGKINSGRYGACAVADPKTDTVFIIGGDNYYATDEVVRYDIHGDETQLPNLTYPRSYLGCSGYYNNVGNLVLVVTGGSTEGGTEHLEVGVDSTWTYNNYTNPWEISCANANNDVYCLQGYRGYDIQEYDKSTGGFIYKSSTEDERGYWGNFASSVCIDSGVDNWCTYSKSGKKSEPQDHSKPFPERSEDDKELLSDN